MCYDVTVLAGTFRTFGGLLLTISHGLGNNSAYFEQISHFTSWKSSGPAQRLR